MTETDTIQKIRDSLRKDAGLPSVPDVSVSIRTLQDVQLELEAAVAKANELAQVAFTLRSVVADLTGSLGKLEEAENALIALTLEKRK